MNMVSVQALEVCSAKGAVECFRTNFNAGNPMCISGRCTPSSLAHFKPGMYLVCTVEKDLMHAVVRGVLGENVGWPPRGTKDRYGGSTQKDLVHNRNPSSADMMRSFLSLTSCLALWRDFSEMESYKAVAKRQNRSWAEERLQRGHDAFKEKRFGDAEQFCGQALLMDDTLVAAHELKAKLSLMQGHMDIAEQHFRSILSLKPGHAEARNLRAEVARQ